jgi:hypothetical protein
LATSILVMGMKSWRSMGVLNLERVRMELCGLEARGPGEVFVFGRSA